MAFNFGSKPTFGTTASTATSAPAFGGFGSTTTTTSGGTSLFGGFGAKTSAPSLGFGTATTSTGTTGFGFGTTGAAATTTTSSIFNFPTTTTSAGSTGFNFGSTTGTGLGTGLSGFGTGLGTGTTGFGTGLTGTTGLGAGLGGTASTAFGSTLGASNLANQQQQNAATLLANMATAVSLPTIYGDERDALIAKWNQLQAFWGTGKAYFNHQGAAVDFGPENPFCRFKAIGYSCMPAAKDKDGLLALVFSKKETEIRQKQQEVVSTLHKILGSKPALSVCVEGLRTLPDDKTEMIIYIQERQANGTTKRISAMEVFNFFNQNNISTQLRNQLSVSSAVPKVGLTPDQHKQYLDNPPAGIDPLLWQQAKLDNPDAEKLIPVPMIGFSELHKRLRHQEQQTALHQSRLNVIETDISELQRSHSNMLAKIEQYKRKQLELGHRVLQVMVKQEIYRKLGYAIQADEEQLRVQLEAIQAELNAPTQFKGRLNELMSQMRMQNQQAATRSDATYQMDPSVQQEIRQHLKQQQEGLTHLIGIIKDDLEDLKLIEQGLVDSTPGRR